MKTETVAIVVVAGAAALYLIAKRNAAPGGAGFTSLGNVGGVAHSPDITTGGVVSVLGSALPSLTKWFGGAATSPAGIATDQYTPNLGSSTIANPVYPSPAVLPYSYKQQNLDTASLLHTDTLFTPSPITGSSGSYSDGTNNGQDFTSVDYGLGSGG